MAEEMNMPNRVRWWILHSHVLVFSQVTLQRAHAGHTQVAACNPYQPPVEMMPRISNPNPEIAARPRW